MNDKQIGLIIGSIITGIITIPTIYIHGKKSYKKGCEDGAEINQEFHNLSNEIKDMLNE